MQTRSQVEKGEVHYDQVVLKAGFTLKEEIHSAVRPAYPLRPGARC